MSGHRAHAVISGRKDPVILGTHAYIYQVGAAALILIRHNLAQNVSNGFANKNNRDCELDKHIHQNNIHSAASLIPGTLARVVLPFICRLTFFFWVP